MQKDVGTAQHKIAAAKDAPTASTSGGSATTGARTTLSTKLLDQEEQVVCDAQVSGAGLDVSVSFFLW